MSKFFSNNNKNEGQKNTQKARNKTNIFKCGEFINRENSGNTHVLSSYQSIHKTVVGFNKIFIANKTQKLFFTFFRRC
jgi:hypothetical protein